MTAQTAKDRLTWLLNLLPRIGDEEWHTIEELERDHGPAAQRLIADLRELSDRSNVPGGFVEGLQIFFRGDALSIRSSHFLRPVLLTPPEAAALELGLALLESERPPDERPEVERVRKKVRDSLTTKPTANIHGSRATTTDMHADAGAAGDPAHLSVLRKAMRSNRTVEISYQRSGSAEKSVRRVHPYELKAQRGKWMLWGFCETSNEARTFRVDRISAARSTRDAFERPANVGAMPVPRTRHDSAEGPTVAIRYSPAIAGWVRERAFEDGGEGSVAADRSITIDHPLRDAGWAVRHVLQYGPDAVVVAPPEIRDAVKITLEQMLAESTRRAKPVKVRKRKSW